MIEINNIYNMDCVEGMKLMGDNSVDLVLTDPHYNAKDIGPNHRKYSQGEMYMDPKEYKKWCLSWFKEACRVSDLIIFTPGISNTHIYPQPTWQICWHKPSSVSFNRMGGFNAWEPIFVYKNMVKKIRLGQDYILQNTWNFHKGPERDHPCPKPLKLYEKIINIFTNKGETVLDPMAGSGTTAVACKELGRNYIVIDHNKKYCDITESRLKQEVLNL